MPRRAATFTKAELGRAIDVLHAKGYAISAVKPDGTLLVNSGENASPSIYPLAEGAESDPYALAAQGANYVTTKGKRRGRPAIWR